MIRITAKQAGFRRCGIAHPAIPTDHPDTRFSEAELAALVDEPMLIVEVVPDGEPSKAAKTAKSRG